MCKFKVGDDVVLTNQTYERGCAGDNAEIIHCYDDIELYRVILKSGDHAGQTCVKFERELSLIESMYLSSNRYKLHQAIKATGFHAEKLSLATGKAKKYFVGITAESRFNSRGDITEERLNSLLTTLAFAERELLGVGAKTVDEQVKPKDFGARSENHELSFKDYPLYDSTVDYPAEAKVNHNGEIKFATDVKIEEAKKDLDSLFLYPTDKPELSNFTKVGIIAIVILLLILIVKNLVV